MSIYIFLFFLLSLSTAQDDCTPQTCSDHGPPIRFPFRINNHNHPPHCGYPGFDLSCSPNNTATLIDYKSRLIHIEDPNNCFPQQLQNLNLSTTPFQFADIVYTFSLFSCPVAKPGFSCRVTCLGGDGHEVYAEYGEKSSYLRILTNDSLEKFASSDLKKRSFGWKKLLEIAMGITKGIKYLHQGCDHQILHFDIKPHNILLDDNLNLKISNFGQVELCSKEQSVVSMTTVRGLLAILHRKCSLGTSEFGNQLTGLECIYGVIQMLEGDGDMLIKPPNPFASTNPTLAMGYASGRPFNSELEVIVESE
ncbi:hypothetical protein RHSIM_Rhsim03G0204100 [Rhododendron simsii]|uniref:non-specific serine/threonine protein kinase n=1 Tax=Rhododendron simsii TaxID=118357 RepID=A0A834H4M1_RHOSS|nr:hypothetical protein RHSIM_Rhsim03G0204100 [Rhododendron simsii]